MSRVAIPLRRRARRCGQALVEYALVLALISVVAVAMLGGMGQQIRGLFVNISSALAEAGNGF